MAGRGDLLYHVTRHFDNRLHLLVLDRKDPGKPLADLAVERIEREEQVVPDGIAITGDMVFLTTTAGRILAFGTASP